MGEEKVGGGREGEGGREKARLTIKGKPQRPKSSHDVPSLKGSHSTTMMSRKPPLKSTAAASSSPRGPFVHSLSQASPLLTTPCKSSEVLDCSLVFEEQPLNPGVQLARRLRLPLAVLPELASVGSSRCMCRPHLPRSG